MTAKDEKKDEVMYNDGEVNEIMNTLQKLYALDDALFNQQQLQRPPGYIAPLTVVRKDLADKLISLTSKSQKIGAEPAKSA